MAESSARFTPWFVLLNGSHRFQRAGTVPDTTNESIAGKPATLAARFKKRIRPRRRTVVRPGADARSNRFAGAATLTPGDGLVAPAVAERLEPQARALAGRTLELVTQARIDLLGPHRQLRGRPRLPAGKSQPVDENRSRLGRGLQPPRRRAESSPDQTRAIASARWFRRTETRREGARQGCGRHPVRAGPVAGRERRPAMVSRGDFAGNRMASRIGFQMKARVVSPLPWAANFGTDVLANDRQKYVQGTSVAHVAPPVCGRSAD